MSTPESLSLEEPFAIIGYEDVVSGFKSLGFKAYPVRNPAQASKLDISNGAYALKEKNDYGLMIEEVASANTAVCLVQDEVYPEIRAAIEKYNNLPFPIFLPFSKDFPPKADQPMAEKADSLDSMLKDIRRRATGKI